jgi:hypothetical protein
MGMTRQIKRHLNNQHLFHNALGLIVFVLSILNASRLGANNSYLALLGIAEPNKSWHKLSYLGQY